MNKYIILLIYILLSSNIYAQNDLSLEDVEVLKVFNAQMKNVRLLEFKQQIPKFEKIKPSFTYQISKLPLDISYDDPVIRPLAIKKSPLPMKYDGFIQLGAGLPKGIMGKAGYNYHYNEKYDFHVGVNYLSFNNDKDTKDQRFADLGVQLDGKYHLKYNHTIMGQVNFDNKERYFYSTEAINDSLNTAPRKMHIIGAQMKYGNTWLSNSKFTYQVGGKIQSLTLRKESLNETQIRANGNINYQFNPRFKAILDAEVDMNFLSRDDSSEIHAVSTRLQFQYSKAMYSISAGLDGILNNQSESYIFPYLDAKLGFNISDDPQYRLALIGGIDSRHYANSLYHITASNPYINVMNFDVSGNFQKKYFIGIEGQFKNIIPRVEFGIVSNSNKALYQIDTTTNGVQFQVLTDEVKTSYMLVGLDYQVIESINCGLNFQLNKYSTDVEKNAWHLPTGIGHLNIDYTSNNKKWTIGTGFRIEFGRTRLLNDIDTDTLDPLIGLSLTSQYQLSKHFAVFLNLDNLINNDGQRWYGYAQMPFNFIGGGKLKF